MIATLRTLIRASVHEAEDAVIDANGTTLLAQHLREARDDTKRARRTLAGLMARREMLTREGGEAAAETTRREAEAKAALDNGDDALAADLAARIVEIEDDAVVRDREAADLDTRIARLNAGIGKADRRLAALATQLRTARSGAAARTATGSITQTLEPRALDRAEAMAARVRQTEAAEDAVMVAEFSLATDGTQADDLDSRIEAAGLPGTRSARRDDILNRLRNSAAPSA